MKPLVLTNPKPQGDWIALADFFKVKYKWERETQKLIIKLTSKYKMPLLVKLLNDIVDLVKRCNEIAGIEVYYEDILIHETIRTITQGVIEPRITGEAENLSDKRHICIYESGADYILKIT
jgi:hypothetical protein